MAPHSSTLAWKIPWAEEPGRLQSMGSRRVGHDWATSLSLFTFMHWRRECQPTPVFLPENPRDWGAWWAAVNGVAQSWTRLRRLSSKLYQKIPKPSTRTSIKSFKKDVSKKSYQLGMFHMPGMIAGTIKTQLVLASILWALVLISTLKRYCLHFTNAEKAAQRG